MRIKILDSFDCRVYVLHLILVWDRLAGIEWRWWAAKVFKSYLKVINPVGWLACHFTNILEVIYTMRDIFVVI